MSLDPLCLKPEKFINYTNISQKIGSYLYGLINFVILNNWYVGIPLLLLRIKLKNRQASKQTNERTNDQT